MGFTGVESSVLRQTEQQCPKRGRQTEQPCNSNRQLAVRLETTLSHRKQTPPHQSNRHIWEGSHAVSAIRGGHFSVGPAISNRNTFSLKNRGNPQKASHLTISNRNIKPHVAVRDLDPNRSQKPGADSEFPFSNFHSPVSTDSTLRAPGTVPSLPILPRSAAAGCTSQSGRYAMRSRS
jgi:hypothetical protein